ncbi:MAG: hypothetical protein JWM16_2051 [Verrucomicrobiales bacterium]|nr:hypothetical protein [Verrucomicrobiales bacterium]
MADANYGGHAFVYRHGILKELFGRDEIGSAFDINNAGEILCSHLVRETYCNLLISPDGTAVESEPGKGSLFWLDLLPIPSE